MTPCSNSLIELQQAIDLQSPAQVIIWLNRQEQPCDETWRICSESPHGWALGLALLRWPHVSPSRREECFEILAFRNQYEALQWLSHSFPMGQGDWERWLIKASMAGQLDTVRRLLQHPDARCYLPSSHQALHEALMWSAKRGDPEVFMMLVEHGANMDALHEQEQRSAIGVWLETHANVESMVWWGRKIWADWRSQCLDMAWATSVAQEIQEERSRRRF